MMTDTATKSHRLARLTEPPTGYGASADKFRTVFKRIAADTNPYKGTDSYQFEDSPLFFGRAQEEREMSSLFLKGRLCVLHAQSGAGKTSILNARVIPRIEETGIHTLRMTPQSNPLEAMRVVDLLQLIPPPEIEAHAIADLLKHAPDLADKPLEKVLDAFDDIETENPARRNLLAAYEVSKLWLDPYRYRSGRTTPFFCKLLGGALDIRAFWRHFGTLFSFDEIGKDIQDNVWKGATLQEIHDLLASDHARAAHREWIDTLDLPEFGFVRFFKNFWRMWAEKQAGYALCIIIDQFEQIFTLYTDDVDAPQTPNTDRPDWRLRPSFFDELRRLLAPASRGESVLPISVVLSMRDEYIGQLASVPPLAAERETSRYRLEYLSINDAKRAICLPAQAFGYDYDDKIYDDILTTLKKEDRFIEPAHIQIVCDKVWRLFGQHLGTHSDGTVPKVSFAQFMDQTGGTMRIQQDYFKEILDEFDQPEQLEILDMLSDLLTQSSKRNVVEYSTLVSGALRDSQQRATLINQLQSRGIVRQEARMGSQFVEIAHEFMIAPLQKEIVSNIDNKEKDFRYAQRAAASAFARGPEGDTQDLRSRASNLTGNAVLALIDNADRCNWNPDVLDLLVHAAVQSGLDRPQFERLFEVYQTFASTPEQPEAAK